MNKQPAWQIHNKMQSPECGHWICVCLKPVQDTNTGVAQHNYKSGNGASKAAKMWTAYLQENNLLQGFAVIYHYHTDGAITDIEAFNCEKG